MTAVPDRLPLGPWLRRAGPDHPVELVTAAGTLATLTAADWLRLVRQGSALFAPELARALSPREE